MARSIFRPILFGILAGAALFFFGFIFLRIILFFLLIGLIIRFFTWGRWRRNYYNRRNEFHRYHPAGMYNDYNENVIHLRRESNDNNIISID